MEKKSEKKDKKIASAKKDSLSFTDRLKEATEGLIYISEIDVPFTVFEGSGNKTLLAEFEKGGLVEEVAFDKFFERLTHTRDWYGERELARTLKFLDLQKLIEENLSDLKVYRIGRVKIRILVVGRSDDGRLVGLETHAIET